ncbi:hypothetical protein ACFL09_05750 [Planctomycetota bacterium]
MKKLVLFGLILLLASTSLAAYWGDDITIQKGMTIRRIMKNNAGAAVVAGDVIILDTSDTTGVSITTTTTEADPKIFGVVSTGGADQANINIIISGPTGDIAKVSGAIAVDDPLTTSNEAGWLCKGSYGVGSIIGIALNTNASGYGTIEAWVGN